MNKFFAVVVLLTLTLSSTKSFARKGISGLFKLGRGASAIDGIKDYSSGTLSLNELRECVLKERSIESSERALIPKSSQLNASERKLLNLKSEIDRIQAYLDVNKNVAFYSQSQVDGFNSKVDRYNDLIGIYNRDVDVYKAEKSKYNMMVAGHNKKVDAFSIVCAGKKYYEDDLRVVLESFD